MTAHSPPKPPPDPTRPASLDDEALRTIFASAPNGMVLTDLEGRFLWVNPAFCHITGYGEEALSRLTEAALTHPEDWQQEEADIARLLRGEIQSFRLEKRYLHRQGHAVWALLSLALLHDATGRPQYLVGHVQDISERNQVEFFQQRLLDILDTASDFIASLHPDGRIFYLNRAGMRMLGLPEDSEPAGLSLEALHPPESLQQIRQRVLPAAIATGHWQGETELQRRDGRRIPLSQSFFCHYDASGRVDSLSTIGRDISQQKRLERELREAKEVAERANRAKSAFLANVSHELRTPLNAILGYSDLLGRTREGDAQHAYLQAIQTSGKNLLLLINDILDLAKIEAGQIEVSRLPTEPAALLREMRRLFTLPAADKGLRFETRLDPRLPGRLLLDRVRLRQVLAHLVGNAIKFTDQGQVRLSLGQQTSADKLTLVVVVEDSGRGIPPEERHALFAPFKQREEAANRRHGGVGLGLAITKRLVELMGGEIRVEGAPGEGSRFSLLLPVEAIPASPDAQAPQAATGNGAPPPSAPSAGTKGAPQAPELPEGLLQTLRDHYYRRWERIRRAHFFDEIADFAIALGQLAAEHRCPQLAGYAEELAACARDFDIPRMDKLLHAYPELLERLRCLPSGQTPPP